LYNIGLKSIPDNINEYSNLKYLDISFNYIENSEIEKNEKIPKITKNSEEYRKLWKDFKV
jgi:Leucine-rich repeat (LRR) protein